MITIALLLAATFPPQLPGGRDCVTDTDPAFLNPTPTLRAGVAIAKAVPTIDFAFYPGQTYAGKPWSAWGDSIAANGKYYASIGDHLAPAGNAFVFEFDPATKEFRPLLDVRELIALPDGHYTPGKIHSRLDLGDDGWLYCSTHRGSSRATTDQFHYEGDWILRCHPETGKAEIVAHAPVPKHCLPASVLDPKRMIFYGATAPASSDSGSEDIRFFAYDLHARKLIFSSPGGPARCMILAQSTGRVYYTPGNSTGPLMRYDGKLSQIPGEIGIRAATHETPQGIVYTISQAPKGDDSQLFAFDTKTEKIEPLGPAAVGTQQYITALDADPAGRYLYYIPGAHGGSENDGSPVIQFDTQTRRKKVIAFFHPFYAAKYGLTLKGTFSSALSPEGDKLYITWNVSREGKVWDSVALSVLHIPASERAPSLTP